MSNFNNDHVNILDLPDEILLIIFQQLEMVYVLVSLANVNRRFFRLAIDPLRVYDLNLTMKSVHDQTSSINTQALSRICGNILPHIHHQVYKLTFAPNLMEEILRAGTFPELDSLSFSNFDESNLHEHLTNNSILCDLLRKQIVQLNILNIKLMVRDHGRTLARIFLLILSLCKRLTILNIDDIYPTLENSFPIAFLRRETWMYSSLVKLKINVQFFNDCLYLLDGRLDSLSTLIIRVTKIHGLAPLTVNIRKPCQLKCFSLISIESTVEYDELIVPLLCEMINLEELSLSLLVTRLNSTYVNGNDIYEQYLISMNKLNKFTFNICTEVLNDCDRQIQLPLIEDIKLSFSGKGYSEVSSTIHKCVANEGVTETSMCHIYSLPFLFEYFSYLDNCFEGGKFNSVRYLRMEDSISFEYEFFQIVARDFPSLEYLYLSNHQSPKNTQYSSVLLSFPYLTYLDIYYGHIDYVELFLLKTNTYLPRLSYLCIKSESIMEITNGLTKDVEHLNFSSLTNLDVHNDMFIHPRNFHEYFPLL